MRPGVKYLKVELVECDLLAWYTQKVLSLGDIRCRKFWIGVVG